MTSLCYLEAYRSEFLPTKPYPGSKRLFRRAHLPTGGYARYLPH
ncbi:MAG: hypothetical protein WDM78_18515 [Puia sp.]